MIEREPARERTPIRAARRGVEPARRDGGRAQHILALQRRVGNRAVGRLLQRQIAQTVAAVQQRVQQYPPGTVPPLAAQLAGVLPHFDQFMRGERVAYRFGGSLAAWLQGGVRFPGDVDVEIPNPDRMQALYQVLSAPNSGWAGDVQVRNNRVILLNAHHVNFPGIDFDMVSDADPALAGPAEVHEAMDVSDGDIGQTGGLVPGPELIINYLDRMIKKPETSAQKGDQAQIASMLRAAGVHMNAAAWGYWDAHIVPATRGAAEAARLAPGFASVVGVRL